MAELIVGGIVSSRDQKPYVQLGTEGGQIIQLSMAQARQIAMDILQMAARTEADAMIHKFFAVSGFPAEAGVGLMGQFRDFRALLDDEPVERSHGPNGEA